MNPRVLELIKNPKNIYYTFLNSPLKSQEGLQGIFDAEAFLNSLLEKGVITKEQILECAAIIKKTIESFN